MKKPDPGNWLYLINQMHMNLCTNAGPKRESEKMPSKFAVIACYKRFSGGLYDIDGKPCQEQGWKKLPLLMEIIAVL